MTAAASFPLAISLEVPAAHWDGLLAVDLMAPSGTPWLAVFDGEARPIDVSLGGYALLLTAPDGTVAYYAHGQQSRVSGPVRAGQVIGHVGDSGNARGNPHLHFAVGHSIDDQGAGDIPPGDWLSGAAPAQLGSSGGIPWKWLLAGAAVVVLAGEW